MPKTPDEELRKRNLMFPSNFVEDMAALRQKTGAKSDSELLRKAFKLYELIMNHGGAFFTKDKDGNEEKTIVL